MRDRTKEIESIKAKGFLIRTPQDTDTYHPTDWDFNKMKVGTKQIDNIAIQVSDLKKANPQVADKQIVLRAISQGDLPKMREISEYFFRTSGIYSRILKYLAFMYCYDWMVTPFVLDENSKTEKVSEGFHKCLQTLDDFGPKKVLGEIALAVLKQGVYYGYKVEGSDQIFLQDLPVNYCRTRHKVNNKPLVEFNMKFFDERFKNVEQKMRVLKAFPPEFSKGYVLYKQGKLPPDTQGDTHGWYVLDPEQTVRFTVNGDEFPAFISVIPLILDLDEAQGLDREKTIQRLSKIVIQKLPLDKNGELIFDVEEGQQLHNNAVRMLAQDKNNTQVLTTFADVEIADLAHSNAASAQSDDLERVERQIFNEGGVSQMLWNTTGNLALEKSGLNDESLMYNLILQFEVFLNDLIKKYNKNPKKFFYRVQILKTTIYNYKELSKLYKEQMQLGFSKMLPQIALGQSQSSILANAYFENDVLDLVNVFIPPLMSSTMNSDILNRKQNGTATGDSEAGRPEKPDDQKSTKTLQNKESAN